MEAASCCVAIAPRTTQNGKPPSCDTRGEHGFPVPAVHEATATDLVMDRIDGPTMLADLTRQPWRVSVHAALLARLHRQLHAIPAPPWLPAPFTEGDVLVHFDLHPQNVLLSEHGPVVIDWPNAIRGHGEHDVALTWIILQTAVVPGKVGHRLLAGLMRGLFLRSFLRHFDRGTVAPHLPVVATRWLRDRNVQPAEREAITRLLQRAAASCG
jgi:hypothetical protein